MTRLAVWFVPIVLLVLPAPGRAQAARDVMVQGTQAYDDLEFEQAAGLLRRALAAQGSSALSREEAARALIYLTATELLRDRKDSARAIARRVVIMNPRFRPDELVFPPQLLLLYDVVRRVTPAVISEAPADTTIRPGTDALTLRLYASAVHDIAASLVALDGRVMRTLYRGPIGDSLSLPWNGLDSAGAPLAAGSYAVTVSSFDRAGKVVRMLRMPLAILAAPADTLQRPVVPADTILRPEKQPFGPALRVLAPGVLAGLGTVALPGLVARGERPSRGRLVIGGTLTLASVAAFIARRPGRVIPENVAHNRALRAWRREDAEVARRNAERAKGTMGVRIAAPVILTPSGS